MKSVSKKAIEPLTEEELCFFKTYGYLIKPDVLPSQVCDELVDLMWESAPSSLRRHDPDSYQPLPEQDWSTDATLFVHGDKWQYRACGTRQPLIDAMTHPQLWQWGEQLLGEGNIRPPKVDGKPIYMKKCKSCHGASGAGDTKIGEKLGIPSLKRTKLSKSKLIKKIADGVAGTKMKAFKGKLTDDEIAGMSDARLTYSSASVSLPAECDAAASRSRSIHAVEPRTQSVGIGTFLDATCVPLSSG